MYLPDEEGHLGGHALLWLSVMLLGGSAAGPGTSVRREVPGLQITSANALGLISPGLLLGWTGSLPSQRLAQGPVPIYQDTIQTYSWHRATRDCVCWRQVWWEPELTNQSCWWIVVLSNVIVRPPSPPPRGHPLCTVKTDQTGVHELAGKALDEQTLALPCWLNGVRE